jgi:hypothetical protein
VIPSLRCAGNSCDQLFEVFMGLGLLAQGSHYVFRIPAQV